MKHISDASDIRTGVEHHPALVARQEDPINQELFTLHFKWLASPVNLFMRPQLLQRLSLMTYQVNGTVVDLHFEAPCHLEAFNIIQENTTCANLPRLVNQLNDMTSNVSVCQNILLVVKLILLVVQQIATAEPLQTARWLGPLECSSFVHIPQLLSV